MSCRSVGSERPSKCSKRRKIPSAINRSAPMPPQMFHMEQNSEEWHIARLGIPTASEFGAVLAKGEGKTRRSYMMRLLGERLTGEQGETYQSMEMRRGHEMEPDARNLYAFMLDVEPVPVGFIRNGDVGASPDSLVGNAGLLEIKTKRADLLLEVLFRDEVPPEHKAQIQGQLWVSEREWVDFVAYWPRISPFIKRVYRDEPYIKTLAAEVARFNSELVDLQQRLARRAA
ncbi:MAG: lambda exonuclease family protein [Stellaceae bacterium]